jgi:hypothetical protein
MRNNRRVASLLLTFVLVSPAAFAAPPVLIAIGNVSPDYEDFATKTAGALENGIPGNRLGGMGSGLAYLGGDYFIALPDRGPNAKPYATCLDDTASYINRFHTLHLSLAPNDPGSALPFTLTPMLVGTTLLSSRIPLVYGAGCGGVGSGVPALNAVDHTYYFTGRSDNFDGRPGRSSTDPRDARFDTEGVRVSSDRRHVYISDEYGPYVYEFDRLTGERTRAFALPAKFAVRHLSAMGAEEISGNTMGRVANKGMEGLAITPDGRTLVGAMQSPLLQDGGTDTGQNIRLVKLDIRTGAVREYAYHLDTVKTTVSEILAVNDHEFLLDERDSKGLADDSVAVIKKLYKIDLQGAVEVSGISGNANLAAKAVSKDLFLDLATTLNANGIEFFDIPAKLEGIAFGQDVVIGGETKHTLYVSNDNDYTSVVKNSHHPEGSAENPNKWFVFAFDDTDLPDFVPQRFKSAEDDHHDGDHHDR